MPRELPKLIRLYVDHAHEHAFSLRIDGEEFPYLILEDSIRVETDPNAMPSIRVTLIADRVEVVNDWTDVSDSEKAAL
jgi:hypothetical protein